MTAQTLTLTDFLLARIAEDEARRVHYEGCGRFSSYRYVPSAGCSCRAGDRLRAECEAKRRIVEDFRVLSYDYRVTRDPQTEARRFQAAVAVGHIAATYADHPDYREEWRP